MEFVIQYTSMDETQLQKTRNAVASFPHRFVGIIPFANEVTSDEPLVGNDFFPYGSTKLTKIAKNRGWKGAHFDAGILNYRNFLENHPHMLNDNVLQVRDTIAHLKTLDQNSSIFTRPSQDLKAYAGSVMAVADAIKWFEERIIVKNEFQKDNPDYFPPEMDVVISTVKNIEAEWRWFIVDGKIISGSQYRYHGQLRQIRENNSPKISKAQELADIWLPYKCVVMDTALVDGAVNVIEFNTINSSGFYDHDTKAIFEALYQFHQT